jgi:hypothetical protein
MWNGGGLLRCVVLTSSVRKKVSGGFAGIFLIEQKSSLLLDYNNILQSSKMTSPIHQKMESHGCSSTMMISQLKRDRGVDWLDFEKKMQVLSGDVVGHFFHPVLRQNAALRKMNLQSCLTLERVYEQVDIVCYSPNITSVKSEPWSHLGGLPYILDVRQSPMRKVRRALAEAAISKA